MQYHTGAYIIALQNYLYGNAQSSYQVRLKSPKSNRYQVVVHKDYGASMMLEISGFWSCQCHCDISNRGGDSQNIRLKHSDSGRSTDEFTLSEKMVRNGVFQSEDGNAYPFSGYFYGPTQLDVSALNKKRQSVKCEFELC